MSSPKNNDPASILLMLSDGRRLLSDFPESDITTEMCASAAGENSKTRLSHVPYEMRTLDLCVKFLRANRGRSSDVPSELLNDVLASLIQTN